MEFKIKNAELEIVCGITSKLPNNTQPEFAFAGKSNVGKSSLINGLMNRKNLARTSSEPGKTQTINFYKIENKLYFVDLPGYGYAKVSKEVREKWGKLIEKYLLNSKQLRIIFLLVDIRHEPGTNDVEMYKWITYYGFNPVIIATKADKLSKNQINKSVSVIRKKLNLIEGTPIIPFSSVTKQGKEEVWNFIDEYLLQFNEEETEE